MLFFRLSRCSSVFQRSINSRNILKPSVMVHRNYGAFDVAKEDDEDSEDAIRRAFAGESFEKKQAQESRARIFDTNDEDEKIFREREQQILENDLPVHTSYRFDQALDRLRNQRTTNEQRMQRASNSMNRATAYKFKLMEEKAEKAKAEAAARKLRAQQEKNK